MFSSFQVKSNIFQLLAVSPDCKIEHSLAQKGGKKLKSHEDSIGFECNTIAAIEDNANSLLADEADLTRDI
jgi:hypothetical protein